MTTNSIRTATLIAFSVLAIGAGTATSVFASNERGERGHVERSERGHIEHSERSHVERGEHRDMRDSDRGRAHREDREHGRRSAVTTDGPALSTDALSDKLKEQGYASILKVEPKSGAFEVKAKNQDGTIVELRVDGATGAVQSSKLDD